MLWTKYGRDKLWFVGCLGSELRLALSHTGGMRRLSGAEVKPPHLGRECGPCPDFASNTLEFALQLRKITENLSQGNRMALGCSGPNAIHFVDLAIDWPAVPCRPWLSRQATGSTLGQLKYLPNCRTRGFPTSANLESKLSVRALMWSANSGAPRSLCICLLLTYQGAPVARRRHLDCNTCNLRTWERAADLHAVHA